MPEVFNPAEFQRMGTQFLLDNSRCHLWSKPGMRKTSTALSMVDCLKLAGSRFFPVLVIAPKSVAELVWPGEALKWDAFKDLTVTTVLGARPKREAALKRITSDLYVINFENVPWLVEQFKDKWPFKIVIVDEAKRLGSFRLRKGGAQAGALAEIAKHTGRWVNLTGTPMTKDLADLWGQNWFVDFGQRLERSYSYFESKYFEINQYTRARTLRGGAEAEITARLADVSLAIRPEDWFTFEKPIITPVKCTMPDDMRTHYKRMESKFFAELPTAPNGVEAINAAVKWGKLLQMASGSVYDEHHVAHDMHDGKIDGLHSIINELQEPLIVGYFFEFSRDRILRHFPHARVFKTKQDEEDWNAGKIDLMLAPYKSASHGHSWQDGGRAWCRFDQIPDEELRQQIGERVGTARQIASGHHRVVLGYDLYTVGTLDEEVMAMSELRQSMQAALILARSRRH